MPYYRRSYRRSYRSAYRRPYAPRRYSARPYFTRKSTGFGSARQRSPGVTYRPTVDYRQNERYLRAQQAADQRRRAFPTWGMIGRGLVSEALDLAEYTTTQVLPQLVIGAGLAPQVLDDAH